MKHANQNQAGESNVSETAPESSTTGMEGSPVKVKIPAEIIATNHRRAYAMAYVAGFTGRKLEFVAPIVRNSIVRGYLTGERDAAQLAADREAQEYREHREEEYFARNGSLAGFTA